MMGLPSSLSLAILCNFIFGTIEINQLKLLAVDEEDVDRISKLTIDLKHRILSHLPTKEAIRTSVLSSSWKHVCLSLPCLDFASSHIRNTSKYLELVDQVLTNRHRYSNTITTGTTNKPACLEKLNLFLREVSNKSKSQGYVNKWIHWAVDDFHVKELEFMVCYEDFRDDVDPERTPIEFPMSVFDSGLNQVTVLRLRKFVILSSPLKTRWPTLKKLTLIRVIVDQVTIDSITTNCPMIESFEFHYCYGQFHSLNASALTRLRLLDITGPSSSNMFKKVDISAPHLQQFMWLSKAMSPTELVVNGFTTSTLLQTVCFCGNASLTAAWLEPNLANMSQLRNLTLYNCPNLKQVRITCCPNLTELYLLLCNLRQVEIHAPRLKFLSYWDTSFPSSFQLNAPPLQAAKLNLDFMLPPQTEIDQLYLYKELIMFLSYFNDSYKLELEDCTVSKYAMIPRHMRSRLVPPLHKVQHLNLLLHPNSSRRDHKSLVELVDTLLWLCPSPESIFIFEGPEYMKLLKFKYFQSFSYNISAIGKCDRCVSLPIQSWKHEITIENDGGNVINPVTIKHDDELRGYFKNIATNIGEVKEVRVPISRERIRLRHY